MASINGGDTAFVLISAALVMFMTPGLALFYGGMARNKNVLSTIMYSFFSLSIITVLWVLFGYSLVFGPDKAHLIGGLDWLGLKGVGMLPNNDYASTIPQMAFMIYQGMFAIITPALISGAFAERMKFKSYLIFTIAWFVIVYIPIAHWVWGVDGWIRNLGALDFAGGTVVHISSGISALAAALIIGKRQGFGKRILHPHNITMTIVGASILWFGWFGFNAGSALSSGGLAANAFVVTHIAAASAMISWVISEWFKSGKPTTLGAASGAVAGLVAITPGAGYVGPLSAIIIGLIAGTLCYHAISIKWKFGYDDALDVVGVHFVGGTFGSLATGFFAQKAINQAGNNGLLFGNPSLVTIQFIAVAATMIFSFTASWVILKVIDGTIGLRVSDDDEKIGLDLSQHGEVGYVFYN